MPFIKIGELLDNYIIVVDKGVAVMLVLAYLALLASVPMLANRPQPVPAWR